MHHRRKLRWIISERKLELVRDLSGKGIGDPEISLLLAAHRVACFFECTVGFKQSPSFRSHSPRKLGCTIFDEKTGMVKDGIREKKKRVGS